MMSKVLNYRQDEQGFILVTAMIMLVILSFIGIAATNTTIFELQIAGNERQAAQEFDVADSGWRQAVVLLNNSISPPSPFDPAARPQLIKDFGRDGINIDGTLNNIPYRYNITYKGNTAAVGSPADFQRFNYTVESIAGERAKVEVRLSRVFQIGYGS